MKNSKSNDKISVTTFFRGILVTTYQPSFIAYLDSFLASRYNYYGHPEHANFTHYD